MKTIIDHNKKVSKYEFAGVLKEKAVRENGVVLDLDVS